MATSEQSYHSAWGTSIDASFLGRGWAFPPRWREAKSRSALKSAVVKAAGGKAAAETGVELVSAGEDIRQSISIILETMLGERVMQPDFGSDIQQYVFAPINPETRHNLGRAVRRALLFWERRIRDIEVTVSVNPRQLGRLDVEINFSIDTHRTRQSLIYPFYVTHPERH